MAQAPIGGAYRLGGGTLTDEQAAYLRSELGPDVDLVDAQGRYTRLGDVTAVVTEVLRERLATLVAGPASFSVSGVYSQDTSANITALREQLSRVGTPGDSGLPDLVRYRARPRTGR